MATGHHRRPGTDATVDDLEHLHHTDIESVVVQLRAVGRALEAVTDAVEELGTASSVELPAAVASHLEAARWELKNLA